MKQEGKWINFRITMNKMKQALVGTEIIFPENFTCTFFVCLEFVIVTELTQSQQ